MKEINVQYKGLKAEYTKPVITDEQFDQLVAMQLEEHAVREEITNRPAEQGDEIFFDYAGFMGEEQFPGGTAQEQTLILGSNAFIPGFEDQCIGKEAGVDFDVNVKFPEDYPAPMLAGQDAVFHCRIHKIFRTHTPELNEEFAFSAGGYASVDDYLAALRKEAEDMADKQARFEVRTDLMHKMVDGVELDVSKEVINAELDVMMAELSDRLAMAGFTIEQYTEQTGQSREFLRASMLNDAIYRVRLNIVLEYIAEKENITISQEEVDEVVGIAAMQYQMTAEDVLSTIGEMGMESFKQDLLRQKTENFILENAELTAVE